MLPIGSQTSDRSQPVVLDLTWTDARPAFAPEWSGLVTDVNVVPPTILQHGDHVITIDGVKRLAWSSSSPPYRPLSLESKGSDVVALQDGLQRLGHSIGDSPGMFGRSTEVAVTSFQQALGVNEPDGVFRPAYVIWIPQDPFNVVDIPAHVRGTAPGPGSQVLLGPRTLSGGRVLDASGSQVSLNDSDARVVRYEGQSLEVSRSGSLTPTALSSVARIARDESAAVSAVLALDAPKVLLIVPPSALVTSGPTTCVFVGSATHDYESRSVVPSTSLLGAVVIEGDVDIGELVVVNPGTSLEGRQCTSS